ncbi:uncharacterized [Tachysurus ichikawai]
MAISGPRQRWWPKRENEEQELFRFRNHIGEYWSQYPESPWHTYNKCLFSDYFSPAGRRRCGVAKDLGDSSIVINGEK